MVQATFDDANPETRSSWAYPDTGTWDPERNVRGVPQRAPPLPGARSAGRHSELAGRQSARHIPARSLGSHRLPARRLHSSLTTWTACGRVLDRADALGMVVILGVFYFGQDEQLASEAAVIRALENAVTWLLEGSYRNVLLEVNNECDVPRL